MIFTEEELPQSSKEWLNFRLSGIGASEIPIILGNYPPQWLTPYELFLIKLGKEPKPESDDMKFGRQEDSARIFLTNYLKNYKKEEDEYIFSRNVYNRLGEFDINEPNFVKYTAQYEECPIFFCSFDGIDVKNKLVLEIKCPKELVFRKILANKVPKVPKTYFAQVQMQLLIANSIWGIENGIFAVYYPDGVYREDKKTGRTNLIRMILIKTQLDREYCKDLEKICKKFWKNVENRQWNKNWKEDE